VAALAGTLAASRRSLGEPPPAGPGVWVVDTLGELGLCYAVAGIAFVGGSLIARGGQNPLEPARLGCAVAVGPHTDNFAEPVAALAAAGALERVPDAAALARWADAMLTDPLRRCRIGEAGIAAASRDAGLPRTVAKMLAGLLSARPA
jgi:3-deoxy-D-manno-octulosonic-acid transferase